MFRKLVTISTAAAIATLVAVSAPATQAGAAAGDGLVATMSGSCSGIDAKTSSWDWTKPSLEMSTDGTTYGLPTGYGLAVCREDSTKRYSFQILKADGVTKELGADALTKTFRITVPPKTGDNMIYVSGYSNMTSFSTDRKSTRLNSSHIPLSRMPSSA